MKHLFYFILLLLVVFHTPEKSFAEESVKITNTLNVRSGPSLSSSVLQQVHSGETLRIVGDSGEWLKVSLGSDSTGWIAGWLVTTSENSDTLSVVEAVVSDLQIRSGPGEENRVIGSTKQGETWQVSKTSGNWTAIHYHDQIGWVATWLVEEVSNQSEQKATAPVKKEVVATILNVREKPGVNNTILTQLPSGTVVSDLKQVGEWSYIRYNNGETGWVDGTYLKETNKHLSTSTLTLLYHSINLRGGPGLDYPVIAQGAKDDKYEIVGKEKEWYEIILNDGTTAYIADWIVSTGSSLGLRANHTNGKTVILDAGHGGEDSGALGLFTYEKLVNLRTTKAIAEKLKDAGIRVILTRDEDRYVSLSERTNLSGLYQADAFVSVHYDSTVDPTVSGITTYYYHEDHKSLASSIHNEITQSNSLRDRGTRFGNYYVLRNNSSPSVLLELGYLSNPFEERQINKQQYQANMTSNIANGIISYLNKNR
ncbi:N-acetylmuramoyl-L-alanine amidase [Guptibacillus algicola]|uniref:N-acetylmuramoyl-L-alanine amidase n=1 Tax=Guptibacillus algicola TaxID=225844 RepID=UPI001CD43A68|nr:N-acetylmuramoyl-L-alanine amidase [Alkalihalobacillus algicola]MCA0986175.1 N-acetylmuramoyl-L-alanine amidase [Alkalihalobacillus algicola]